MDKGRGSIGTLDPREALAGWANQQDEWVRSAARRVLSTGRTLSDDDLDDVYKLFREEKHLDERSMPVEPPLTVTAVDTEAEQSLTVTKLWDVTGVNALVPGSVIEPHAGMTILFGENGTGKTGYSRVFKALAGSRTADRILGDVGTPEVVGQSAKVQYTFGSDSGTLTWAGEHAVAPFTRMSIFDSPAVNFHTDDDLEYVYVPSALALFNHMNAAIKGVHERVNQAIKDLGTDSETVLSRFPRESMLYPIIEKLGAATDLAALELRADREPDVDERIGALRHEVAVLEANTLSMQISELQRTEKLLNQAASLATALDSLDTKALNVLVKRLAELREDYRSFRTGLFSAADLPADPEETWNVFVTSGEAYRAHLDALGVHDSDRCLYCRQQLGDPARALISKYREYLTDRISSDIADAERNIGMITAPVLALAAPDVKASVEENEDQDERPVYYSSVSSIWLAFVSVASQIRDGNTLDADLTEVTAAGVSVNVFAESVAGKIQTLKMQSGNLSDALKSKKRELTELTAAAELGKTWLSICEQVERAKEAEQLRSFGRRLTALGRSATELAKGVSDQLVNQNFELLFAEECRELRAPKLRVEFVGRQGRAHRRKSLGTKDKPSKVLSEGEQKVLALADFLAEARLAGITAPVVFDDPVSSLDHRRINDVARRIARIADDNQVIVFTHDIFFAVALLSLFETSKRCTYYQITDEGGKGTVTRASGPRWDSIGQLRKNINATIEAARGANADEQATLVREGYSWIRSWCEVFTETELLAGVSQRYQPNIRMTTLGDIKTAALPAATRVVTRVFADACRYIPGHSQPLVTLGVAPTLSGLEADWAELEHARKTYLKATG